MKGTVEFRLNETTMIEAMQEYFDTRFKINYRVEVMSVKWLSGERVFIVTAKEIEDAIEEDTDGDIVRG